MPDGTSPTGSYTNPDEVEEYYSDFAFDHTLSGLSEELFEPNMDALDTLYGSELSDSEVEDRQEELIRELNDKFGFLIEDWQSFSQGLALFDINNLPPGLATAIQRIEQVFINDPLLRQQAVLIYPGLEVLFSLYTSWRITQEAIVEQTIASSDTSLADGLAKAFTREGVDQPFVPAMEFRHTQALINDRINTNTRENVAPSRTLPWEFSIGLSKFSVPPLSISVDSDFKVTSLTGGALRQPNSPKFNTGHSETSVNITLYFPNHESIWGYDGEGELEIDFENDSDDKIDRFMSSLRGLVSAFRYSPFLPVRNQFLNSTFDMTGASLYSMTLQTLEGFPFVIAANITLLKFNHKAYLPMINDFSQAVHWGRYRQYSGRAAEHLARRASQGFLVEDNKRFLTPEELLDHRKFSNLENEVFYEDGNAYILELGNEAEYDYKPVFDTQTDFNDGRNFQLYYPRKITSKLYAPDLADFRTPYEDEILLDPANKSLWEAFMTSLGFDVIDPVGVEFEYDNVIRYSRNTKKGKSRTDFQNILTWLDNLESLASDKLTSALFEAYYAELIENRGGNNLSDVAKANIRREVQLDWYALAFFGFQDTPYIRSLLQDMPGLKDDELVKEWEVPMEKMAVDWSKVTVNGISVTLGNNIVRHQLQMQEEPVHQHIGGRDSTINVSLTVQDEDQLVAFRRVFSHINGLARIEHAHGVLGFLGIKNVLTSLCGIKYLMPLNFSVSTVPGYPHVYSVNLSFVDFDILQQKREVLDSGQQQQLINAFGKRNPFLRIKQLWGAINSYPEFPLSVEDDDGNIIGHLDPDYYFRSFQTLDDDLAYWGQTDANKQGQPSVPNPGGQDAQGTTREEAGLSDTVADSLIPASSTEVIDGQIVLASGANDNTQQAPINVSHNFGSYDPSQSRSHIVEVNGKQLNIKEVDPSTGDTIASIDNVIIQDDPAEVTLSESTIGGHTAYSNYQGAYSDPLNAIGLPSDGEPLNAANQYQRMMLDTQYRGIAGRMISAFPTFMLWLIDEGGTFAGVRLFDNFYGLNSVIDFSVVQSEDILGDTLVLRVSNMYQKLSKEAQNFISYDPGEDDPYSDENDTINFSDNIRNQLINNYRHMQDDPPIFFQELNHIRLKPGVRLHLRAGYGSNINGLDTIFNGVITEVQQGDIVTIVAQSDAIELSSFINTSDKDGHSGRIDGSISTGFFLSEPRDLMVRLLSMGTSTFKEQWARASKGVVFSENKFGIRHFGHILYEPMTDSERERSEERVTAVAAAMEPGEIPGLIESTESTVDGINALVGPASSDNSLGSALLRSDALSLMSALWTNSFRSRDMEIFKRNIYPGNGTGIMQFAGIDTLDADSLWRGFSKRLNESNDGQVSAAEIAGGYYGGINDAANADDFVLSGELDPEAISGILEDSREEGQSTFGAAVDLTTTGLASNYSLGLFSDFWSGRGQHPALRLLGLSSEVPDDDLAGHDEVSFRAQTYMKTVWDMFKICAAMLPNYIVAVRPFEDRSTVFYGKPHWLYTSGVIPLTTGIPKSNTPPIEDPNEIMRQIQEQFSQIANPLADHKSSQEYLLGLGTGSTDPYTAPLQREWGGGDIAQLDLIANNGAIIPDRQRRVSAGIEMHLPTHSDDPTGLDNHIQSSDLPLRYRYPFYMDRDAGESGGYVPEVIPDNLSEEDLTKHTNLGENPDAKGAEGAFGILSPQEEQYYMAARWPYSGEFGGTFIEGQQKEMFRGRRVLVFNEDNGRMCVVAPGDYGPHGDKASVDTGLSPEAFWYLLGKPANSNGSMQSHRLNNLWIGWVDDNVSLGPVGDSGDIAFNIGSDGVVVENFDDVTIDDLTDADSIVVDIGEMDNSDDRFETFFERNEGRLAELTELDNVFKDNEGNSFDSVGDFQDYAIKHFANDFGTFINLYGWAFDNINPVVETNIEGDKGSAVAGEELWADSTGNALSEQTWKFMNDDADDVIDSIGRSNITIERAGDVWQSFRDQFLESSNASAVWLDHPANELAFMEWGEVNDGEIKDFPQYQATTAQFLQFMWADPYRRAWVAVVMDVKTSWWDLGDDSLDFVQIPFVDLNPTGISFGELVTPFEAPFQALFGGGADYSLDNLMPVWSVFSDPANEGDRDNYTSGLVAGVTGSNPTTPMDQLIQANRDPGSNSSDPIRRQVDNLGDWWDRNIGAVLSSIGDLFSAVITGYRLQMAMMGLNLNQAGQMQLQATILNKVLNDSIYYDPRISDPLVRLADNAFTREYGEPVVEVREPFQRLHFLSSFNHILSNGISENLTGVNTVVTATSDGKYPVTVYFDKGSPAERQQEGTTETGLFWDNARGSGFFSFLHPILHPVEYSRGLIKETTSSSDELLSKRIALSTLRESLKDMYTGEMIVLGDAGIRPHDLIYISDYYERVYGLAEVEQVVHHFTPDQGFITSITPNALVTVNDPARWSFTSYIAGLLGVKDVRDTTRSFLDIKADSLLPNSTGDITVDSIHDAISPIVKGSIQYTNGNSALIRDLQAHANMGFLTYPQEAGGLQASDVEFDGSDLSNLTSNEGKFTERKNSFLNAVPFAGMVADAWDWVNENLQDQHGCYISYLNKDGQPMDAGLGYNQGIAVGQWYSKDILPGLLNVPRAIRNEEGHVRITNDDLLSSLGWTEVDIDGLVKQTSWWVNQTNKNILGLSGYSPDPITIGKPNVVMIRVTEVVDGDTIGFEYVNEDLNFDVTIPDFGVTSDSDQLRLRFSGINTPELRYKLTSDDYGFNDPDDLSVEATNFVEQALITDPANGGYDPIFALRIDNSSTTMRDNYGRVLGVIFHTVPEGTPNAERARVLYDQASQWPINPWDSYHLDGRPYTLNWELVTRGLADVYLSGINIGVRNHQDDIREGG
jgi:hypothetical protein